MSGIVQVTKTGPRTFVPAETILGGQVVEGRAGGKIGVAAAGSLKPLGIAITDGVAAGTAFGAPTVVNGVSTVVAVAAPQIVSVVYGGIEVKATYAAAATFGDLLVAAAGGKVTPAGADADPRAVVGRCTEPAGVAANAVGLVRTA